MGLGTPQPLEPCPTFNAADWWLGIDTSTQGTGLPARLGCDVHCEMCIQESDLNVAISYWGSRWGKPMRLSASRNSKGEVAPLVAGTPQLFPAKAAFYRGACWENGTPSNGPHGGRLVNGIEHFRPDRVVCMCDPWLEKLWGDLHDPDTFCRDGTDHGELRSGPLADLWFFIGHSYNNTFAHWGKCRRERQPFEDDQLPFYLVTAPENVYAVNIARSHNCQHDLLSICVGAKHSTSDCMHGQPGFHNDNSHRAVWNYFNIPKGGMTPWLDLPEADHPYRPHSFMATLRAQNRALEHAEQIGFSQLENPHIGSVATANTNINVWQERIEPDADGMPYIYMDASNGLTGRLRHSGAPVIVYLRILSAYLVLHFSLWKIKKRIGGSMSHVPGEGQVGTDLMAAAQVHLHMELGADAYLEEPVTVHRPWMEDGDVQLEVAHSASLDRRYPVVTSTPNAGILDVVDFLDPEGHPFTPPREVDWWGSAQELTEQHAQWRNLWPDGEPGGTIASVCCTAARGLGPSSPLRIFGSPTDHGNTNDSIHHYRGSIVMHLPVSDAPGVGLCAPPEGRAVA